MFFTSNALIIAAIAIAIIILFKGFFVVDQQFIAVVERFGKFARVAGPGLRFKIPFIEWVRGRLSLRIQQLNVTVETKTKDNVFLKVIISVQYHVLPDNIYDAFYRLTNAQDQILSFVFDVVRAQVPTMELDTVFENKDNVANAVKEELTELMSGFGYGIVKALVTDIDPDPKVKTAMNEINEQKRLRMAAQEKGEAEKILKVKQAEAEAESMRLNGQGIADQRKAIIAGLRESVHNFQESVPDVTAQNVMDLVLMAQYYDTLKEIGAKNNSSTILLPSNAGNMSDALRDAVISGNLVAKK